MYKYHSEPPKWSDQNVKVYKASFSAIYPIPLPEDHIYLPHHIKLSYLRKINVSRIHHSWQLPWKDKAKAIDDFEFGSCPSPGKHLGSTGVVLWLV